MSLSFSCSIKNNGWHFPQQIMKGTRKSTRAKTPTKHKYSSLDDNIEEQPQQKTPRMHRKSAPQDKSRPPVELPPPVPQYYPGSNWKIFTHHHWSTSLTAFFFQASLRISHILQCPLSSSNFPKISLQRSHHLCPIHQLQLIVSLTDPVNLRKMKKSSEVVFLAIELTFEIYCEVNRNINNLLCISQGWQLSLDSW